jgi:hypothetical protein
MGKFYGKSVWCKVNVNSSRADLNASALLLATRCGKLPARPNQLNLHGETAYICGNPNL